MMSTKPIVEDGQAWMNAPSHIISAQLRPDPPPAALGPEHDIASQPVFATMAHPVLGFD